MRCEIRLVSEDRLLETQEVEAMPNLGDEIVAGGEVYVVAAPPAEAVGGEAVVYVAKVA